MKRCPQCEFIYEDDQSLCDMDGVLLVLDARNLPNLHALAPVTAPPLKTQKRNRTVPAFATVILALVLGMVYYVSTQRGGGAIIPPVTTESTALPGLIPAPPLQVLEVTQPVATETKSPGKEEPKPEVTKPATTTKKSTNKTSVTTQPKPPAQQKKDESKVGSILKKTGRILKKPFKL